MMKAAALIVVVALSAPATAGAQAPEDRAALERFRDALADQTDSLSLRRLERAMIDSARTDRSNTLLHLRLGFVALRLGEIAAPRHYDDAASEFQWAIDLQPDWPYPWFGMGLAEYGIGDPQVSIVAGIQGMLGKDALSRSALAFAKSAEVDPSFALGLSELAATALRQRINIKLGVALDALRRSAATAAGTNPAVLLARGRVEREAGDMDSALAAFRAYAATGPNRALGLLEVARTRLQAGELEGQLAYYEGAASDDSAAVAGYRADLSLIAADSVMQEFDRARGQDRVTLLRTFWSTRDDVDLRDRGERLAEHYRRYFYARKNFFLATTNRHYDIVERYRSGSPDFDDRGVIYIRHGAPSARASFQSPGVDANESWRYTRADGDLVFHFIAREDVQDYKLVESVFDVLGFGNTVLLQDREDEAGLGPVAQELILSRQEISPMYGRLQRGSRVSAARYQQEERRLGRTSMRLGTTTDSHELSFGRELKARTEVLAVGRDASGTLVQITYAIPGSSLEPVRVSRGMLYSVRLRFAALDSAGGIVAVVDTTRRFVSAEPVPAAENLVGRVAVSVPPGHFTYRLALQQGEDAGVVLPRDTVRVGPPASAGGVRLSDLVLGSRAANLVWHPSAGDSVFFNPLHTFRPSDELMLYYEIGGIPAGKAYTTEVVVKRGSGGGGLLRKIFGGSGAAMTLRYQDEATDSGVQRSVGLERLKPGTYTLEVTVSDGDRKDRRSQQFVVTER